MSWQLLFWNIFIWCFTGTLIYLKDASMWWLILPFILTAFYNGAELMKTTEKYEGTPEELVNNPKAQEELFKLIIKTGKEDNNKRSNKRREWL